VPCTSDPVPSPPIPLDPGVTWANDSTEQANCTVVLADAGLQNQRAACRVAGGFDSRPPPPPALTAGVVRPGHFLPAGGAGHCRRRGGQDRHLPRRALPPARPAPRQETRDRRPRQLDPHDHLEPALRPRRQLPRPGTRLLSSTLRQPAPRARPDPQARTPDRPNRHPQARRGSGASSLTSSRT
jgi:hypothetical protein